MMFQVNPLLGTMLEIYWKLKDKIKMLSHSAAIFVWGIKG